MKNEYFYFQVSVWLLLDTKLFKQLTQLQLTQQVPPASAAKQSHRKLKIEASQDWKQRKRKQQNV